MENFIKFLINPKFYVSLIVIIVSIGVYLFFKKINKRLIQRNKDNKFIGARQRTYLRLFNNILKYVLIIIVIVIILKINGVNVTSIIAGLGLASVIAGLALQDALKDIIMGFNIIVDNYFSVGEVVKIGEIEGKVIEVGLKCTKLKDIYTGNNYIVSNRNISEALKISEQLDIDIPLPYEKKLDNIEEVLDKIISGISELGSISNIEYKGINEFADSAIYYKLRMNCSPENKPQIKRDAQRIVKKILDENNIEIPYTQIDIHTKN